MSTRFALIVLLTIVGMNISGTVCRAQEPLDFVNGGEFGAWVNAVDLIEEKGYGPTKLEVNVDGELVMSTNGDAPSLEVDDASFICITLEDSLNGDERGRFTNGFTRATISPSEGSIAGILMRENIAVGADYEFWRNTADGTFFIGRFNLAAEEPEPIFELLASTEPNAVPYEDGERWIMEAGVVGNELSLRYWRSDDVDPPMIPQLTVEDDVFSPFGDATQLSLAVHHLLPDPFVMSAVFGDVSFTEVVPEPSTFALVLLGFPAFAMRRFIRRKVNVT